MTEEEMEGLTSSRGSRNMKHSLHLREHDDNDDLRIRNLV